MKDGVISRQDVVRDNNHEEIVGSNQARKWNIIHVMKSVGYIKMLFSELDLA